MGVPFLETAKMAAVSLRVHLSQTKPDTTKIGTPKCSVVPRFLPKPEGPSSLFSTIPSCTCLRSSGLSFLGICVTAGVLSVCHSLSSWTYTFSIF